MNNIKLELPNTILIEDSVVIGDNVEIKATGIEIAKQKLLELHSIVLDLKRLGLKNKTINLLVKDISLKVSDE